MNLNFTRAFTASRRLAARASGFNRIVVAFAWLVVAAWPSLAAEANADPSRIIQYRGPMPLLAPEHWGHEVELRFELYRSPDGGAPFWKERRTVAVSTNGWVSVDLGQVTALPDEAFTTPFRFLSIWREKVEFTPRKQVASLAYVAAPGEPDILAAAKRAGAQPAVPSAKLDRLVDCGAFRMEANPRSPTNWLSAVESARQAGARLPTFQEWYGAYDDGKAAPQLTGMAGHYEWVIPWVYEPTIHARLHELYRGKPVACYYEELSPMNAYPFRLVVDSAAKPAP